MVLRNEFPLQTLSTAIADYNATTRHKDSICSNLNGGRKLAIRSVQSNDDAFEIHSSVKRQFVVRSTSAVNRRPQKVTHRLAISTHVHAQSNLQNSYELSSLVGGVPSVSGTTFQLQDRRKIREKLQGIVVGGRSSDSHLQPKATPSQQQLIRSAESSVNCRRQHSEHLSPCRKDAVDNRADKFDSDQTSADASRLFPTNFLRLREKARLSKRPQHSAQMSRCDENRSEQLRNAPQRPTTTTPLRPASQPRKASRSPTQPTRRQTTIRKVVQSFVDHVGRKEKGANNDLRKNCKKSSKIPSDVDVPRAGEYLVPSSAVTFESAENVAIDANFSFRGHRSKSPLAIKNDDNSRSSGRLGGARSTAREKSLLHGMANHENGLSGTRSRKSSFRTPDARSRKLCSHSAKSPIKDTTMKLVAPAKDLDCTSQDDYTADDGQKEAILAYTIQELMEADIKTEDGGEESRLRNERIVKWLRGLSYGQTERPPTPFAAAEETQNDAAIHFVYDGD